ncbi:protein FAM177A1-like [Argonauta hians]
MAEIRLSQINLVDCVGKDIEHSSINLEDGTKNRTPKRILHFSDGIIEEFSSSEDEGRIGDDSKQPLVRPKTFDPRSADILPWIWFYITLAFRKSLKTAEICGEKIGSALGITTPKYQYAIDEYKRRKKEEEEALARNPKKERRERF